jgi:hypothetical protein
MTATPRIRRHGAHGAPGRTARGEMQRQTLARIADIIGEDHLERVLSEYVRY